MLAYVSGRPLSVHERNEEGNGEECEGNEGGARGEGWREVDEVKQ